ncbi:MAG: carbohydrate ABC transporter permease [Spirochaetaceae bacterium]|jgi:raffinose/stachyose/melibiose transport system permease protein|nr:carbohydrate ABC transporter permease [Spirochaetaceae bacterium]
MTAANSQSANNQSYFLKKRVELALYHAALGLGALVTLAPLWLLLINSFKSHTAIVDNPLALPSSWDFQFIINAAGQLDYVKSIGITFVITLVSVTLIVLISSMSAWIIVRSKSKLGGVVFMSFVAAMLIPFQAIMYPLIQFFDSLGLKNIGGLFIMYGGFGLSMSVFLYHGFVKGVPMGVEEAAFIDGCNIFQMFFMIVMPLLQSITVTVIIINAMWIWNDYLLPFLTIGNSENKTLVLALYFARILSGQYGNPWQLIFPAVLITIVPIVVVFLFLQRYIVAGISAGAIKA